MKVEINSLPKTTGMNFLKKKSIPLTTMLVWIVKRWYDSNTSWSVQKSIPTQHWMSETTLGASEAKWSKCLVFPSLLSDICLHRTHKDLLIFFKYICKCSYKAQKWFASILKHGIPTFGFFKCLKLFNFFSHDTCRVSRLKNKQIFTWYKALEGRLYHIWSYNQLCIAWPLFQ